MNTDLESLLARAYALEAAAYRRALDAGENLKGSLVGSPRQGDGNSLQDLLAPLEEVAAIEADIQEAKEHWRRSSRKPGRKLQAILDEIMMLIQALRTCVDSAADCARAESERLLPQIDEVVRCRQMQTAYRGHMAGVRHLPR